MALRRTAARQCGVYIQPMYYTGTDVGADVPGFRKPGRGELGMQAGTLSARGSSRPLEYDGPTYLPCWHFTADIWRPKQARQALPGEHTTNYAGSFKPTAKLMAVRPLLEDIFRHRTHADGPVKALERWDGVKKGYEAGLFDDACLHRAGYYVLDVLAEHKDIESGEMVYAQLHDAKAKGGFGLPFDVSHVEKMVWLCYRAGEHAKAVSFFEDLEYIGVPQMAKTQTFALAAASYGRESQAAKGITLFNKWVALGRDVHSFPAPQLAELVMGCTDEAELRAIRKPLRLFNDLYLEALHEECIKADVENDKENTEQLLYYVEWLYKSRRHTMLHPTKNAHFFKYALGRVQEALARKASG